MTGTRMYLSEDYQHGSRGSLVCSRSTSGGTVVGGPPVTPDSVVGTNLLLGDGNGRSCYAAVDKKPPSAAAAGAPSSRDPDLASSPQLLTILKTEGSDRYAVAPDYLHSSILLPSTPQDSKDQGVSERCRRRTCEWMYDICDYFRLNREVVGIALFYVDRYFTLTFENASSSGPNGRQTPVTRRKFQLVALTGLYIAVKLHGESRREQTALAGRPLCLLGSPSQPSSMDDHCQPWNRLKFSLAICASISRNQFSPREIEACERDLLRTLDWHVNPVVSSGSIIDSLLVYLPSTMGSSSDESLTLFVYDCAKYLAELSVSVPALSLVYKPSVVAYASILYALDALAATPSICFTSQSRREYERIVLQVSSGHFEQEKLNVVGAQKILQAICPNLGGLFPLPTISSGSQTPESPTSVTLS